MSQPGISFSDVYAAQAAGSAVGLFGGPWAGVAPPPYQSGKLYWPQHCFDMGINGFAITANRLYRAWIYIATTTTFSGAYTANTGVGDNGVVLRMGVWNKSGALEKDFGVSTLSGAAALRQLANSVTLTLGWHQIALVSSGTPAIAGMSSSPTETDAGTTIPNFLAMQLGAFQRPLVNGPAENTPIGDYAAFTYGVMPDPITTATATVYDNITTATFPLMGLYV